MSKSCIIVLYKHVLSGAFAHMPPVISLGMCSVLGGKNAKRQHQSEATKKAENLQSIAKNMHAAT